MPGVTLLLRFCAAGDKPSGGGNHPPGRTRVKDVKNDKMPINLSCIFVYSTVLSS